MDRTPFARTFDSLHAVLPVIHVRDRTQALANTEVARLAGADGVFLINHDVSTSELLAIHAEVAQRFPRWFVGVNCLGLHPLACFDKLSSSVAGLWVDDACIDERADVQTQAEQIDAARKASGWQGLYFGGVAFKYRREVEAVEAAARAASKYMDVVTTSGPGTGAAASVEKIRAMKAALGHAPLAIASGITPENIHAYLPHAHAFLVATGISRSFHSLDPKRVAQLVAAVRAHDRSSRSLPFPSRLAQSRGIQGMQARGGHAVLLTDYTHGAVFEIDLDCFAEAEPVFAYDDNHGDGVRVEELEGLREDGDLELGRRQARLLRATRPADSSLVRFRSCAVGEFDVKIHHIPPDGEPRLLWHDDFCFK